MEKNIIKPEILNKEKAKWFILTMNNYVVKAFKIYPEIGIGYVKFSGLNHEQIDLSYFQRFLVCGITISKTETLGLKDCLFQNLLIAQISEPNLRFLHFSVVGKLNIKNLFNKTNMEKFDEVEKTLVASQKANTISPNFITLNNFLFKSEKQNENTLRKKILNKLAGTFLVKNEQWYQYEKPIWVAKSPDYVAEAVRTQFKNLTGSSWIKTPFSNSLINDLKANCVKCVNFNEGKFVVFKNGILNLQTMEFEEQESSAADIYKNLYCRDFLPYTYQTLVISNIKNYSELEELVKFNTPNIYNWFFEVLEDFELIAIVFCFAAAIIKQYKLDRFLFFFGPSNTGKSTALRFFDKLFINSAVLTKQLSDLSSPFGLAELIETNVRLLVVRDAESSVSDKSAAILKNLSSNNEPISISRKFLTSVNHIFSGGIIIASNYSTIFQKTARGILEKRIIPIEFPKVIAPEIQKDFCDFFPENEMSFFLSIVMKMEKNYVLNTLRLSHKLDSIKETRDSLLESGTHSLIFEFVNEKLIYSPEGRLAGGATPKVRSKLKNESLYGAYLNYVDKLNPNRTAESYNNFKDKFDTVLQSLGWSHATPKEPDKPPVQASKVYVELKDGSKKHHRGYLHITWKTDNNDQPETDKYIL